MNYDPLDLQLTQLLNEVKHNLSKKDFENIKEFIYHNEYGLAYETLCTQLYEHNVSISKEFYENIYTLSVPMEINPLYWTPLQELITSQ